MTEEEKERAKLVLDKYYAHTAKSEKMAVADALAELQSIAEELVDCLTDIVWYE